MNGCCDVILWHICIHEPRLVTSENMEKVDEIQSHREKERASWPADNLKQNSTPRLSKLGL